jgi:hypothetical protein
MAKSANDPVPLSGSLMLVLSTGSSERGGVGHHYEAAAADPAGSRPGDPGGGGPEHGQVSPCFLVDCQKITRCQRYLALRMSNYLYYFRPKQHILVQFVALF